MVCRRPVGFAVWTAAKQQQHAVGLKELLCAQQFGDVAPASCLCACAMLFRASVAAQELS